MIATAGDAAQVVRNLGQFPSTAAPASSDRQQSPTLYLARSSRSCARRGELGALETLLERRGDLEHPDGRPRRSRSYPI